MTAVEYLKENSDWFDKSPGGEKLYFESEVIRMMENYSSQTEISDEEIEKFADEELGTIRTDFDFGVIQGMKWYREQLKSK